MRRVANKPLDYKQIGFKFQNNPLLNDFSTACIFAFCKQMPSLNALLKGHFKLSNPCFDGTKKNLADPQIDSIACQYQNVVYEISSCEYILPFLFTGHVGHKNRRTASASTQSGVACSLL
jgi:hypothetical protein